MLTTNLLTRDVDRTTRLYRQLSGLPVLKRSDAYTLLAESEAAPTGLLVVDWVSELVPRAARGVPQGVYLSLVTPDLDAALALAGEMGLEIIESPAQGDPDGRAVIRDLDGRPIEVVRPESHLVVPPTRTVG